jgi:hypothetical protein
MTDVAAGNGACCSSLGQPSGGIKQLLRSICPPHAWRKGVDVSAQLMTLLEKMEVGATRTIDAAAAGMSPEQFHAFIDDWYENGMGIEGFELAETPHKPSTGSRMYDKALVKRVS